ncbi:MAG: site-specific recombinase [Campylobacterales bacterium]|nr:site-specific recombinase [Campylobacterales bacterium]
MPKDFENTRAIVANEHTSAVEKLTAIVEFIRPEQPDEHDETRFAMRQLVDHLAANPSLGLTLSTALHTWILESRISTNLASLGILSKNGFGGEFAKRFYSKFLPSPPKGNDFKYLFATLFHTKTDHLWVDAIDSQTWVAFIGALLRHDTLVTKTKDHLFYEILYGVEILSIWIASEEFDENFIRLDASLLKKDSAFIALQRDVSSLTRTLQDSAISLKSVTADFEHIEVLLEQCRDFVVSLKKKSINKGISLSLTYELERLGQIINRTHEVLSLVKAFGSEAFYTDLVALFKEAVKKNSTRNSLREICNQNIKILAKSIANNASEHGEHYITETKKEYLQMFASAAGAGVIIALMALFKINISQMGLGAGAETLLASLNYGFGFVLIHLLGFTVATKQPAMTASTFAKAVEKGKNNKTNHLKLVDLIFHVSRSQFAAVAGNVTLALGVAFGAGYWYVTRYGAFLSPEEAAYYVHSIDPFPALLFAGIAGVWLFCSGIIAGYFDNRADFLDLKYRYMYHPFLIKITSTPVREKLSTFLHENHGAIMGNFIFGLLLGTTPYIGAILNLPLDIRHVAFSTANLGYSMAHVPLPLWYFLVALGFVLMIGLVNLAVSFSLALMVSLRAREARFGSFWGFVSLLRKESTKRPLELVFPPKTSESQKGTDPS